MSNWFEPSLTPKEVSTFLEVSSPNLPRITSQTIGRPSQPSRKRGGAGRYSGLDALLMKLGLMLLDIGLSPGRCQACLEKVKKYILATLNDQRVGTKAERFVRVETHLQWLVGKPTITGYDVDLHNLDQLGDLLKSQELAAPHIILNLKAFIYQEGNRLAAHVMPEPSKANIA
jgi:hypothetical protein